MKTSVAFLLGFLAYAVSPVSSSADHTRKRLPVFLAHVDDQQLEEAKTLALERHGRAVAKALENYPTNGDGEGNQELFLPPQLKTYSVKGPGALPDFDQTLQRKIFVTDPTPLLSKDECDQVIQMAEKHFNGEWPLQASGQYMVAGFYIKSVPSVHEWFTKTCRDRLFPLLSKQFKDFVSSPDELCVDNAYLFKYTRETGQRTDVHTDSGTLSFTIALNGKDQYSGGGTWFEGLEDNDGVLEMNAAGQVTIRPGGLKHCGHAVQDGTRYIIGGFCMHRHRPELVRQLLTPDTETSSEKQLRAVEAAVVLNPLCDAAYNILANEYDRRGDKQKARELLEYCLGNVHPSSGECAYSLGSLYMEDKLFDKAKRCMEICLKGDPCDVDALSTMAQVCSALGDRSSEELYYRRLIEIPGAKASALSTAYCNLGVLYDGKEEEADFYLQALAVLPTAFAPRYCLACYYASQQQWEKACETFRVAIINADTPDNADKAVRSLYQAASNWVRYEHRDAASWTREKLIEKFQEIMGVDNYQKLAAGR